MSKKPTMLFDSYITKRLKTSRCLAITTIELALIERGSGDNLYNIFVDRLSALIPIQAFKGISYTANGNKFLRVMIIIKPNLYTFINEKMRYSGRDYLSLTNKISNLWSKLLFDTKSFPRGLDNNFKILSVDILNGVELEAKEVEKIVEVLSNKFTSDATYLEKYTHDTKKIALELLTSMEFNKRTFSVGYNVSIDNQNNVDLTKFCIDLTLYMKNNGVDTVYCFNRDPINNQSFSIIIFDGSPYTYLNFLSKCVESVEPNFKDSCLYDCRDFGEMDRLIDPREYSKVKLEAERIFTGLLTSYEPNTIKKEE